MVIIDPQIARKGISSLIFRVSVFVLVFLGIVDGFVVNNWIKLLVSHRTAVPWTIIHSH